MELDGKHNAAADRQEWLPKAVLAGGLALTLLISLVFASNLKGKVRHRFEADVEAAHDNIQTRTEAYLTLIRGIAALFNASSDVTRVEWRLYVERLRIRELYSGLLGLGFSLRMRAEETNRLTILMQQQGATGFHVWPEFARPEFHSIIFLEPLDERNAAAIGYDMYTDPIRRQAMEAAWTNGTLAASGKVRLVQEIEGPEQAGFLIYFPVYYSHRTPPSVEQRRADLHGFVYAPFRADDFLRAIFGKHHPLPLQMSVYDGDHLNAANLLHESPRLRNREKARLHAERSLQVADRKWTLAFSAPPSYDNSIARLFVPVLPLIGTALTLLLYYLTSAQVRARTRAEVTATELQASEELHRTISETAADAILTMNEQSIIISANDAAEQLFGYSSSELIGQPITMLMPERMRARHRHGIEEFLKTGRRHIAWNGVELPGLHKDGHEISLEISFGASQRKGKMIFTGFLRDITRRKEIEEQRDASLAREQRALAQAQSLLESLQESEAQLRLLTDALPALISYIDRDQRYRLANRAYERWFGLGREAILGKTLKEVIGESNYEVLRQHVESALAGKEVSFETVIAYRDANRNVRVTYVPHRGARDEVLGLFVMVVDITEQKQTEIALKSAQEQLAKYAANLERKVSERTARLTETIGELEAFSYSVSHDLRAPLRAMQGFSHVLLEDYGKNIGPEEKDYLKRIVKASERMDRLIQDVLAYSRASRTELELHSVDLEKLIRDVIQHYPALQASRAEISIQRPLLHVIGHDASLTQCFSNLLANAVKFVAPGVLPKIRIWTELRDGMVRVWIEDNGIGIARSQQERIFGMFQRAHGESQYEGTGIGLAIVSKAIQRMGGELGVESEVGKGSRFWFELRRGNA